MSTQTTTQINKLDPAIAAAIKAPLDRASRSYLEGDFSRRADDTGVRGVLAQQEAAGQQLAREGLGAENLLNELDNTRGAVMGSQQGALGSARADRARQGALLDKSLQLQEADQRAKAAGLQAAGSAAKGVMGLDQAELDRDITGAERYFGLLQGVPQAGSSTTTAPKQGGGGKK